MVYYFTSSDGHTIYMGKDKFENEDLIKFGWPEDIWFHVDDLSSAHVYLRLKEGESWDKIDEKLIAECCQLVKANSIEGSKKDFVKVVYTPWENLFKGKQMEVGAVGFKDEKQRRYVNEVAKDRDILRAVFKTKDEQHPNLQEMRETHLNQIKREQFNIFKQQQKEQRIIDQKNKEEAERRDYKHMMVDELMTSNKDVDPEDDDFM